MTTTITPRTQPRRSVVATFNVRNADESIATRYDIVHAQFEDGHGGLASEYLVNEYDHSDFTDGRIQRSTPFDTVEEAIALALHNCGWGDFALVQS